MSKIICELCGTAYPDTADCCPVCGTKKPETAEFSAPTQEETAPKRSYTPTKGGRFSNANVRKRLKNKGTAPAKAPQERRTRQEPRQERPEAQPKKQSSNKGLVITAVILLLAIIGMLAYIYVRFLMPAPQPEQPENTGSTQQDQQLLPQQTQGTTEAPDLSCKDLTLSENSIILNQEGSSWLLNAIPEPANTVDAITYVSGDTNVATVSADGKVTAVGSGETVITITCGTVTRECKVVCDIAPPTTVPETTVPAPTAAKTEFKLNREDITFESKGESWLLYKGEVPLTDITWSTSNSNVATINNGVVKAVGAGKCTVTAEYNGQTVSCVIRCSF